MNKDLLQQHPPAGVIVLMYHRIERPDTNPWGICISPENFEKQIRFLAQNFDVISVDELVERMTSGNLTGNSICLTFDDAYADNYIHAKPILEKYNCPAAFFIPTAIVGHTKSFWWDELEMIFLHSKSLPGQLSLQIGNETLTYQSIENELSPEQWVLHKKWKWHLRPATERCKIFLSIWTKLTALRLEELTAVMNVLKKWSWYEAMDDHKRLPMKREQLYELSQNKLFTLGMHTHTHCDLSQQKQQIQLKEIKTCKSALENMFKVESHYLSYPFGRYNDDTIQIVTELQVEVCFTTQAIPVTSASNRFLLGRYQPFNWTQKTLKKKIDSWFAMEADNFITHR